MSSYHNGSLHATILNQVIVSGLPIIKVLFQCMRKEHSSPFSHKLICQLDKAAITCKDYGNKDVTVEAFNQQYKPYFF